MRFYRNVQSRTLGNGVRIFVFPQPGTAVEVECFVRTGSIHEGKHLGYGLSHFLEHMLFQGCRDYPGTAAADAIDRLGGSMNAYTSYDHTAYHANLAGRHLPEAVRILSRMVRFPEFPEARFAEEREVILREEEMGRDNPDRLLCNRLNGSIFRNHPLRHPIIGYRELISKVTREIMAGYYEERYTPERCFWVIVGDAEPEYAFELVENEMADWERRSLEEPAIQPEPAQCVARREAFSFADPLARLAVGVRIPEISHADVAGCDVLAGILGMGDGSRLVRTLELERQLAVTLRSFSYSQGAGGLLAVTASTPPGKLEQLESALLRELDAIRNGALTRAEVEREKTQQYAEHLRELRSIREIAANIGGGVIANEAPDLSDAYLEQLGRLTLDDLNRIAATYLSPERLCIVRQLSGERKRSTARKTGPDRPEPELTFLDNTSRLVTLSDRRLPLVDFALTLPGGAIFEPREIGGVSALTADLLNAGAGKWKESALLTRLDAGGANFSVNAGLNSFTIECTFPRRHRAAVFQLLKAIVATPAFGQSEFDREKANRLELLKSRELSPRAAAEDRCRKLMFGNHPYGWGTTGRTEQLANITRDRLAEFYFSRLVPGQAIFGWSGDCSRAEAAEWTAELCEAIPWRRDRIELPPEPVFPSGPQFEAIPLPREQTMVLCALPGPALNGEMLSLCEILFQAENGLSSPVFKLVREENSLAYSTGMRLCGGFHPGWLLFYAVTTAENAERALSLLETEIQRLATEGLTPEEFDSAREGAAFAAARSAESTGSLLISSLLSLHYGRPLEESLTHEAELRAIRRGDFVETLKPYLSNPAAVRIFAGRLANDNKELLS